MHNIDQVVRLLKDYLHGKTSPESNEALRDLLETYPDLLEHVNMLESEEGLKKALASYKVLYDEDLPEHEDSTLQHILTEIRAKDKPRSLIRFNIKTISVAASIVALFFVTFYTLRGHFFIEEELTPFEIATTVTPGTHRAVLETPDGRQIELSSDYEGIIVGDEILYEDGSVLIDDSHITQNVKLTLSTPRGGQYQVSLADGTKVWLNADSKLHYPRVFSGDNRTVELTGEAYFEVAKDESRPFIVQTASETVEVLGTHFNVNAYDEESSSSVALLEGKVNVSLANQQSKTLLPGQQSIVKGDIIQVRKTDISESVAWKNGEFMFNNESLSSVMRKLARWYDIEVELDSGVKDLSIWGSMSRYDTFDEVLQIIKMIDENIKFKIEGRRIKIMK